MRVEYVPRENWGAYYSKQAGHGLPGFKRRVEYVPRENWDAFYSRQAGHGLPGFEGTAFQRGGGLGNFLGRLFRFIIPVAKKVGKAVGKQALASGADFIGDVAQGKNPKKAAKKRGRQVVGNLADQMGKNMRGGSRLGKRLKRMNNRKSVASKRSRNFFKNLDE